MKTREQLLNSQGYWIAKLQLDLYEAMKKYMEKSKTNKTQLAEKLGVTKGYITQILNGDFDHKLSKLVQLSLAIGKVPIINYEDINVYIHDDELGLLDLPKEKRPQINILMSFGDDEFYNYTNIKNKTDVFKTTTFKKRINIKPTPYFKEESSFLDECITN